MAEMAGMSKDYIRATRDATICPASEMSKMSEMAKMSNMTTRHVMHSLGKPIV